MNKFDFDDINLIPRQCIVESRSECDTSVLFGGKCFSMPVIPANMSSVITPELAEKLAQNGYFYILHRFLSDFEIKFFVYNMNQANLVSSISVGVKEKDYELIRDIKRSEYMIDFITIDIAHGHADSVRKMIEFIKEEAPEAFIIAGNVSTRQAVIDLEHWGADAVKVGIAPGKACFIDGTKIKTIDAYKNIEDVEVGDKVLTHDGTYQEVINTITYESNEKLLNINGEICTEDHEFYIANISDLEKITDNNYLEFCYFEKAKNIDTSKHKIIALD